MASLRGLSLRDLEYTQTIANEGHFGRAASLCGVSQPAISSQIQKLEARIGFPIFERQGKSISVTENGRIFLAKAETILTEARELLELSSSLTSPMEGELRLGVIPTLGPYFLPLVLKSIKNAYPKLHLSLIEEPTSVLEQMLADRKLDIMVLATDPNSSNCGMVELFFEPYFFASPSTEGLEQGAPVTWSMIKNTKLVLLTEEHCMRSQTLALCHLIDEPGQRMASSLEMLRQMVALGDGAALLPALSVNGPDLFGGLVTTHPISDGKFGRSISLQFRNSDPRADHLKRFGEFLTTLMAAPAMQKHLNL